MAEAPEVEAPAAAHDDLPVVLLLRRFPFISAYNHTFATKFRSLNPSESTLPLHQFLTTHAKSVTALITSGWKPLKAETLRCLPSLRLVVTTSAGLDHIDLDECRRRGICVANAGSVFSEDVADYCVALVLAVLRRVSAADRYVRGGLWPQNGIWDYPLGSRLWGKRVGIVGLGNIGSEIAKRLEAFSCKISYTSREKKLSVSFPYYSNVCDLATNSDILVICCALSDETHHFINRDVLLALGKNGIVVNVGRGALVHEKELVQCLMQGEIGGAGLDVYENEPNVAMWCWLHMVLCTQRNHFLQSMTTS